jgi:hypothetical protein
MSIEQSGKGFNVDQNKKSSEGIGVEAHAATMGCDHSLIRQMKGELG